MAGGRLNGRIVVDAVEIDGNQGSNGCVGGETIAIGADFFGLVSVFQNLSHLRDGDLFDFGPQATPGGLASEGDPDIVGARFMTVEILMTGRFPSFGLRAHESESGKNLPNCIIKVYKVKNCVVKSAEFPR